MIILATVLLSPILFLVAMLIYGVIIWRGWRMPGVPNWLGFALIFSLCMASFLACGTIDELVATPAMLQQRYIGEQPGTPLTLKSYEFSGFQDPNQLWTYRLSDAAAARLRKRCLTKGFESAPKGTCMLFSDSDDRWAASVELKGNELVMDDGLW
jgi:hypothetical protein